MIQLIINIFKSYISNKNTLQARLPLGQGVITRPLSLGGWTMLKNNYTKNNLNFTCFFYKIRSKGIFSFLFNKYTFLNVNAVIFLIIIFYKFFSGLKFDIGFLSLIISFFISFLISSFVLNKFKFSNNSIISLLQKFIFINILMFIFFFSLVIYYQVLI